MATANTAKDRQSDKKKWEIWQGTLVANSINEAENSDYTADAAKDEPADVALVSASGKFPSREAQVVSIPLDFRHRNDKHTVEKISASLEKLVLERGAQHLLVGVILAPRSELHGMPKKILELLADIVTGEGRDKDITLGYLELESLAPDLCDFVHILNITHHPELIEGVRIDIPAGSAVPTDGRWIEEGIRKKVEKYGGENAVKDLMLIIGVAGFVDERQVDAFRQSFSEAHLPFAEIWINTDFHGTHCLKRRRKTIEPEGRV